MNAFWSQSVLRRLLIRRLLECLLLLVLVGACFLAYREVYKARLALEEEQLRLVSQPKYLQHLSTLRGDLRGRSTDIERILQLVVDGADIVNFIAHLEETATNHDILLEVPSIVEVQEQNAEGQPIESTGPFRAIQLTISGQGEPSDLLEYIHKLEHDQRLVAVPVWEISTDVSSGVALSQTQARAVGDEERVVEPAVSSKLQAEFILVVHNEKYSSQ